MKHKARKRFGQNFLIDGSIIARIVSAIAPKPGELVLEIGPGQEALTGPLMASGAEVKVVEIDRDLAAQLRLRHPDLAVINEDALKVDFTALADGRPYRLVGNLPYNISTPLLFHLLDQDQPPADMHFMLQAEVVDRMNAGPGSKAYGRLSLMCQVHAEVVPLFGVPPEAFDPRPKVDSAIVRLVPRPEPLVPAELLEPFDTLVRQAFSLRRKTLRNSLRKLLPAAALEAAGVDPSARPEQVDLEGFRRLASALAASDEAELT